MKAIRWNNTVLSVSDMYYLLQSVTSSKKMRVADIQTMWGSIPIPSIKLIKNTIEVLELLNYVKTAHEHVYSQTGAVFGDNLSEFKSTICKKLWLIADEIGLDNLSGQDAFLVINDDTMQIKLSSINNEYKTIINLIIQCSDAIYEGNNVILKTNSDIFGKLKIHRKTYTSEMQRQELEEKAKIGKIAENYVFQLELKKLAEEGCSETPKLFAEEDVGIGYDILSYELKDGETNPKYIEVKAITQRNRFFISQNEVKTAKRYGNSYWLYLVYLDNYTFVELERIKNPYDYFFKNQNNWTMEIESYKFNKKS